MRGWMSISSGVGRLVPPAASKRTKDALAAAKRRGTKLGGDRGVVPSKKARAMSAEAPRARADAKAADLAPILKTHRLEP